MAEPGAGNRSISVLYADRDEESRRRIVRELEGHAAIDDVDTVSTGDDLRSTLAEANGRYDCLITECDLESDGNPLDGTDGPAEGNDRSVLEALPTDRVPTVVYTDGDETIASDVLAAGASGYVPKTGPDPVDRLLEQVLTVTSDSDGRGRDDDLHEVALAFDSCETIAETYQLAVDTTDRLLDAGSTALLVDLHADRGESSAELVAVTTSSRRAETAFDRPDVHEFAERVFRSDEPDRLDEPPGESVTTEGGDGARIDEDASAIRSVAAVPVGDEGVVLATSTEVAAFADSDLYLLEFVATHVASAIDRIRTERALRSERDRFVALFESVPDAIVLTEAEEPNRILDVNPAFEDLFGFDRTDVVGTPVAEQIVPDGREPIGVREGTVVSDDVERLTADGPREFLARGFAVDAGTDVHEYAIYTDITERKRRERDLERYRTLVETVGDPMYVLDPDGWIQMINEAMARTLGEERETIVGRHATDYMPREDVERGTDLIAELLADDERQWGAFEMTVEPASDDPYVAENNLAPLLDEDGSFVGSAGVIRDVSDRKERERRIHDLHDGTRRLMAAEGAGDVATVATEIARDALGLELNSVHLYDEDAGGLAPAATTAETRELLGSIPTIEPDGGIAWDAYESTELIAHGDVRRDPSVRNPDTPIRSEIFIPLDDHGVFIVASTEPNDFDAEVLTFAKILASNVEAALERAQREAQLARRSRELERQNERLEQFAGTVSHDLRNPLTLASGHLEAVDAIVSDHGREIDAPIDTHLEEVEWALDRMDDLVENVLTLARSGKRLSGREPVALESVVDRARRTVDPDLEVVRDDSLPTVEADADRLVVLFENVFRNAREHAGEDATVTVTATDDGFAVDDDGPGIDPDKREAIFESGYSSATDGTGFGLAIVREVVDAHGWDVAAGESGDGGLRLEIATDP
ncbi:hybrid sensor histidine kinase/response regulator [Natrarchaeobius oligotrophus]|uniref:histidine kinase n=1 Tax=Natrarchaeobius chitinivorans TaxID=1679083 RepID=A0A3N6MQL9_NATCH|nr:PAS domain S-box protein [Natrarchaeobius chitinivorans]RQG98541.1 PAS domain S-box protein [Natrarchaeobius chitinivorans]